MDGFHLSRAQLAAMPNAAEAIHRRGAAFTFDGQGFFHLAQRLREPLSPGSSTICTPGFDHAIKDPVADEIPILPTSRVLIFEGNFPALDREPWRSAAGLMDEPWFIDVDREVARERLVKRHVIRGVTADEASARHRIASTDFLNADDILENRLPVQEIVRGDY
ncbi:P-loop containing nucleoside triphosphate hydrolase protein [Aspergillus sclerotioniger CBS 115572]|uniref:P-loop containing nucleoside triphosphate hydrolase protein n=1 Tax=Aspergillus sclerotioniger CBS 115572 TaxID=1450535 RepID=A0A317XD24_9EURO|nr:P-loop containing nucleoside triphosphate hydrolase protein [Aspergillus sclerotioniger CBS 115572]PWY96225.1 P-loop containing nucleoside triphosphate hydrolase protein [Aspergillus sclerotioniger CBS 115572]